MTDKGAGRSALPPQPHHHVHAFDLETFRRGRGLADNHLGARDVEQFVLALDEKMMVGRGIGIEIRLRSFDRHLAQQADLGELVQRVVDGGQRHRHLANPDGQLVPAKHVQGDLFICDVADAVLKDLIPQMEHPFYSLSKKPETSIRRYEHNGNWLQITPSVKGLATIYDKDILIYCISQLIEKMKHGEPVGPRLRISSYDLLVFTNRGTAGKDYSALCEAIDRLAGTRISTNIRTGDEEQTDNFGLIDAASIRSKHGLDGRLLWVEIKLSEWVFNAIKSQEVLTLHRDYFRLRKPLER